MRQRRRPNPYLSRARAFWRLARKEQKAGNYKLQDWYAYQAQVAYGQYRRNATAIEQRRAQT